MLDGAESASELPPRSRRAALVADSSTTPHAASTIRKNADFPVAPDAAGRPLPAIADLVSEAGA